MMANTKNMAVIEVKWYRNLPMIKLGRMSPIMLYGMPGAFFSFDAVSTGSLGINDVVNKQV